MESLMVSRYEVSETLSGMFGQLRTVMLLKAFDSQD